MVITSILPLLYLLINFITCIIPFNCCSHYLEAIQLIYDAYRLTGFSQEGTFIINCLTCSMNIFNTYGLFGVLHVILFQYSSLR